MAAKALARPLLALCQFWGLPHIWKAKSLSLAWLKVRAWLRPARKKRATKAHLESRFIPFVLASRFGSEKDVEIYLKGPCLSNEALISAKPQNGFLVRFFGDF
jgi:hypothetical protein